MRCDSSLQLLSREGVDCKVIDTIITIQSGFAAIDLAEYCWDLVDSDHVPLRLTLNLAVSGVVRKVAKPDPLQIATPQQLQKLLQRLI